MSVRFLRVIGVRAKHPSILAVADDQLVRWDPAHGWSCDCDTEGDSCEHVDAVDDLLDDRVTGEAG